MSLHLTLQGDGLPKLSEVADILASEGKAKRTYSQALNKAGAKARTPVKKALVKQTGLKSGTIHRALKVHRASAGKLQFAILSKGGFIALKHFKARETRKGVSAAPRGQRQIFEHTFIKGGLFPNRKTLALHGHAWTPNQSTTKWGRGYTKAVSDVRIPDEMITGASAKAWESIALPTLQSEVHRLIRLKTRGAMS